MPVTIDQERMRHTPWEVSVQTKMLEAYNGQQFAIATYEGVEQERGVVLPTVLFFPGFGLTEKGYDETIRSFVERGYTVHVINSVPQQGTRRKGEEIFKIESEGARDIINRELVHEGERFIAIGNSLGGGRVLQIIENMDLTPGEQNFNLMHSFLISPAGMRKHDWRLRVAAGFTMDILKALRRSRLPIPGFPMEPNLKRRLIAAREDAERNIGSHVGYFVKIGWAISKFNLLRVYNQHKNQITVLAAKNEKTMPPTLDTDILLPDNHFVAVSHSEELVDTIDAFVIEHLQL